MAGEALWCGINGAAFADIVQGIEVTDVAGSDVWDGMYGAVDVDIWEIG